MVQAFIKKDDIEIRSDGKTTVIHKDDFMQRFGGVAWAKPIIDEIKKGKLIEDMKEKLAQL